MELDAHGGRWGLSAHLGLSDHHRCTTLGISLEDDYSRLAYCKHPFVDKSAKLCNIVGTVLCCTTPRRAAQRSLPRPASRGRPQICAMNMLYMNAFIIISFTILANFPAATYSPNILFIAEKTSSTLHLDPNPWILDHAPGLYFRCSMTACFLAGLPPLLGAEPLPPRP